MARIGGSRSEDFSVAGTDSVHLRITLEGELSEERALEDVLHHIELALRQNGLILKNASFRMTFEKE